jgi:hypothetical protein
MAKKGRDLREEKTLICGCGRMSYRVSQDCDRVVCCKCLIDKAGGFRMSETNTVNDQKEIVQEQKTEKKNIKAHVNPIDPATGKRKRGRPAKVKPQNQ